MLMQIGVKDSKTNRTCREKVAALNAALDPNPDPPPPPPPPTPPPQPHFTPVFCAGMAGEEDDDWEEQPLSNQVGFQALFVNLSSVDCQTFTLPLLARYLGDAFGVGDLFCNDGYPSVIYAMPYMKPPECPLLVAALNDRLGGSAFECNEYSDFLAKESLTDHTCREKAAALNPALAVIWSCNSTNRWLKINETAPWSASCLPCMNCTFPRTFQAAAPTWSSNRICKNVSPPCTVGRTFQAAVPTRSSDRICKNVSPPCTLGSTFQEAAPTLSSDRVCKKVSSPCSSGISYAAARPTRTTDRSACIACTPSCPSGKTRSNPCTPYSNLQCTVRDKKKLSPANIAEITVGAVAVAVFLAAIAMFIGRRTGAAPVVHLQRQIENQLTLLTMADQKEDEMREERERRSKVWQIPEDHVKFLTKLASGGFGDVWMGAYGGQPVAIKLLKRALDDHLDPAAAEDYRRENEVLQSIRHPHLLLFIGSGTTSNHKPFLVTEFMELGSLHGVLADAGRVLDWKTVRQRMAVEIAAGMAHLHTLSIVHRDLKSENCLCDGLLNTKVADFGASRLMRAANCGMRPIYEDSPYGTIEARNIQPTQTMTKGAGTLLWMAPEVFDGSMRYGPEVDVYSYGVIMWELLTRRQPWDEIEADSYLDFTRQLDQALKSGRRPAVAAEVEQFVPEFVALMRGCWATESRARPGFAEVVRSFGAHLPQDTA